MTQRVSTRGVAMATTLAAIITGSMLPGVATAHPQTTAHCKKQTFSWTRGKTPALNSTHGPRIRRHAAGSVSLDDNEVTASFETAGQVPTKYVNITGNGPAAGEQLTRLLSVTVVPVKGKAKTYKIDGKSSHDYVYSRQLLKDYEQVQLPVNGKNSEGLKIQRLKKVVVTAKENCYATQ